MRSNKGFTLIEMAVVLSIIAVLAAILTPMVVGYVDQARIVRATADAKTIADAVRLYQRDTSRFPIYADMANANNDTPNGNFLLGPGTAPTATSFGALGSVSLLNQVNNVTLGLSTGGQVGSNIGKVAFRGPYLGALESDPWGNQFVIPTQNLKRSSVNWAFVVSAGQDGTITTTLSQPKSGAFAPGGDDIAIVIN